VRSRSVLAGKSTGLWLRWRRKVAVEAAGPREDGGYSLAVGPDEGRFT
jgi:hypothetical protein